MYRAIRIPLIQLKPIRDEIVKAMEKEGKTQVTEWKNTTKTFKHNVDYAAEVKADGNDLVLRTGPISGALDIWGYLNYGTSIRWALMSSDWRSKTQPRRFAARSGRGKPVIIGRSAMQRRGIAPRPGIAARDWIGQLDKKRWRKFRLDLSGAIVRGARNMFP